MLLPHACRDEIRADRPSTAAYWHDAALHAILSIYYYALSVLRTTSSVDSLQSENLPPSFGSTPFGSLHLSEQGCVALRWLVVIVRRDSPRARLSLRAVVGKNLSGHLHTTLTACLFSPILFHNRLRCHDHVQVAAATHHSVRVGGCGLQPPPCKFATLATRGKNNLDTLP